MKTAYKTLAAALLWTSFSAQAGTINAGFYFDQACLAKIAYQPIPEKLTFACTKGEECFTNDLELNALLLCAKPFGQKKFESDSIKIYQLSQKGLNVK